MKLIPLFRFGGDKEEEEEEGAEQEEEETDLPSIPTDEMLQIPSDEQPSDFPGEGEETSDSTDDEEKQEEDPKPWGGSDDDMLKAFASVENEDIDNSSLAAEIEDVPASELLQELRALATAFGRPVPADEDDVV
jgi:hypothetical protein